eukprot:TRINITY_DN10823_c0_g1_i1.p1 TRINITY_DN10823_c0_g1~~TRINITY_DN10823_c0_g1_i1.p1  ORF type:complete len:819 (+),score=159.51 TRINITY_DN10823_c0_g1_i1:265-2721(+)
MSHLKNAVDKTKRSRRGSKLFTAFPLIEQKDKDAKDPKSDSKEPKDTKEREDVKEETAQAPKARASTVLTSSHESVKSDALNADPQRASLNSLLRIKKRSSTVASTPLSASVPIGAKRNNDALIMLATAVKSNNARLLYNMLQQGMDVNMTDKDGQTAVHLAAAEKEVEGGALLVLLAFQANIHITDSKKWTPLHVACNAGNWKVCKLLLDRGADAKAEAMGRIQPLHYLARTAPASVSEVDDFLEVMAALVARGGSVNHQTDFGETVLHYCAYGKGSKDVVRFLLKKGADPNLRDRKGASPLHIAVMQQRIPMVKILLRYGADRNLRSDWGTPIELAKGNATLQNILAGLDVSQSAAIALMDPKQFMKNTISKELTRLKTDVASLNSSNQTMQQSIQNSIADLLEKINTWSEMWKPDLMQRKEQIQRPEPTPQPEQTQRPDQMQQMSSEEIILAVGRGGKPPEQNSKRKSPNFAQAVEDDEPAMEEHPLFADTKAKISSIGPYHLGGLVGSGAVGRVFKGFNKDDGEFVAVKEISLSNVEPGDRKKLLREIQILKQLNHENIVKYIDCHQEGDSALYVIMEFIEAGTLKDAVKKFGKFPETLVAKLLNKIVDSIVYIHNRGIVHRDIKGANIMLTKEGSCKLTDFGIANQFQAGEKLVSCVGTPCWMAPELIAGDGYGPACDIWSLGCLAIELLTGAPPFSELSPMFAMFRIVEVDDVKKPVPIPEDISSELKSFLQSCLRRNPALRPTAEQLKRHAFLRKYDLTLPGLIPINVSPRTARLHSSTSASDQAHTIPGRPHSIFKRQNSAEIRTRRHSL